LDAEAIGDDGLEVVRTHVDGDQGMARAASCSPGPEGMQRDQVDIHGREAAEQGAAEVAELGGESAVEQQITVALLKHPPLMGVEVVADRLPPADQASGLRITPGRS